MSPWLQILSALGASVVGGVIAPQITNAKDRRAARAAVIEKARDVEVLRWGHDRHEEFAAATIALEAAAVIARVPRDLVTSYVEAARNARQQSYRVDYGDRGGWGWGVDGEYGRPVELALERISRFIWHPWLSRLRRAQH